MTTFSRYTRVLLAALACHAAQAFASPEFGIAGRIAPVNSCVPTLLNGNLDYGVIKASELDRDGPTFLPEKILTVTVACQALVNQFTISFEDRKKDDAIRDTNVIHHPLCALPVCGDLAFGLGRDQQNRKIGALFLVDKGATKDDQAVNWWNKPGAQDASGTKFSHQLFGPLERENDLARYAPEAADSFRGMRLVMPIGITPVIDSKGREVSGDIRLDGAITMEIRAL
jgi:hypothetical protein